MPLVLSSKCYLFFPVAFLGCEHESLLSSHALIGHQGAGNTEWPEQRQPWHFSGRALSLLDISCSSPPLPHLIASLAGQRSPLEHSKSCCFQKKFVSSKEKKKKMNHYNCLETQNLFFSELSHGRCWFFCFVSFGRRALSKHLEWEADCVGGSSTAVGRSDLIPCSKWGREQTWALCLWWPSLGPSSSRANRWNSASQIPGSAHQGLQLGCGSQQ